MQGQGESRSAFAVVLGHGGSWRNVVNFVHRFENHKLLQFVNDVWWGETWDKQVWRSWRISVVGNKH